MTPVGTNVPVKLKLQRPPAPGISWAFDCALCPGRGDLNVALEGWGI